LSASATLLAHWPCNFAAATCQVGPVGCTSPNSLNSVSGLIGQISLVGQISLISLSGISGISGLISHNGLVGFTSLGLISFSGHGLVSLVGLIGNIIDLIGLNNLSLINGFSFISLIGLVRMPHWPCWPHHHISIVGQISLVSVSGLIGHNGLVGFIGLGFVSLVGFISLFGHIGLVGRIGHSGLIGVIGLSLICLVGLLIHWPLMLATHGIAIKLISVTEISNAATFYSLFVREMMCWWLAHASKNLWWWIASFGNSYNYDALQYCLAAAILAVAAKMILQQCIQAARGVVMVSSAIKITNAEIWYNCAASLFYSHLFVRESWLWHLLSRPDSYFFGDALQNAKQIGSTRLPQMTKYGIMRECDNIHS
jgi:hypothetical protein